MSSKNKPKRFCILTSCGLGHGKKVFDQLKDGDYYIIEPGAQGGGLSQTVRAFLDPSLPREAAEHSPDNKECSKPPTRWRNGSPFSDTSSTPRLEGTG